jgi:hypothetical protein
VLPKPALQQQTKGWKDLNGGKTQLSDYAQEQEMTSFGGGKMFASPLWKSPVVMQFALH